MHISWQNVHVLLEVTPKTNKPVTYAADKKFSKKAMNKKNFLAFQFIKSTSQVWQSFDPMKNL